MQMCGKCIRMVCVRITSPESCGAKCETLRRSNDLTIAVRNLGASAISVCVVQNGHDTIFAIVMLNIIGITRDERNVHRFKKKTFELTCTPTHNNIL